MPQPWERIPAEGPKAFRAFSIYLQLGTDRSIYKAAQEHARALAKEGKSTGESTAKNWEKWSVRYEWVTRAAAFDDDAHRRGIEAVRKKYQKELEQIEVDRLALINRRLRYEIQQQDVIEANAKLIEDKLKQISAMPNTDVERTKHDAEGNVIESQKVKGIRPTEIARLNKEHRESSAQGINGPVRVSKTERIGQAEAKSGHDGPPIPMELAFDVWPDEEPAAGAD